MINQFVQNVNYDLLSYFDRNTSAGAVISFDFLIPPIATGGRQAADLPPTLSRHRHREAAWYSTANLASQLPQRVIRVASAVRRRLPVFPDQRTSPKSVGMSQRCHNRTRAPLQTASYSITSSARLTSVCGTVRPRAFAVLRLISSWNFVGSSTGRSAGLAPFKILCT
jgi:hypothetical protein